MLNTKMTIENDVRISPDGEYIYVNGLCIKTDDTLWKKHFNQSKQILSTKSRRKKHRDGNDDQLERKIKVMERLKRKKELNEKKQTDKQDK